MGSGQQDASLVTNLQHVSTAVFSCVVQSVFDVVSNYTNARKMSEAYKYVLNIRLLMRAINECQSSYIGLASINQVP